LQQVVPLYLINAITWSALAGGTGAAHVRRVLPGPRCSCGEGQARPQCTCDRCEPSPSGEWLG
jgi:hypothetical protein